MKTYSRLDLIEVLRQRIADADGTRALARLWDVSPSYVSAVVRGRTDFGPKLLVPMGYTRVIHPAPLTYRKTEEQ